MSPSFHSSGDSGWPSEGTKKRQTQRHTEEKLALGGLGSPGNHNTQSVYCIKLNRKAGLLHADGQGGRVYRS